MDVADELHVALDSELMASPCAARLHAGLPIYFDESRRMNLPLVHKYINRRRMDVWLQSAVRHLGSILIWIYEALAGNA